MKRLLFILFLFGCDGSQQFAFDCGRGCEKGGGRMIRALYNRPPGTLTPTDPGGGHVCECQPGVLEKTP